MTNIMINNGYCLLQIPRRKEKMEMAVMEQLGNVFTQADDDDHFSDHVIGMEIDHLSALTRRTKTYAKRNHETVVILRKPVTMTSLLFCCSLPN